MPPDLFSEWLKNADLDVSSVLTRTVHEIFQSKSEQREGEEKATVNKVSKVAPTGLSVAASILDSWTTAESYLWWWTSLLLLWKWRKSIRATISAWRILSRLSKWDHEAPNKRQGPGMHVSHCCWTGTVRGRNDERYKVHHSIWEKSASSRWQKCFQRNISSFLLTMGDFVLDWIASFDIMFRQSCRRSPDLNPTENMWHKFVYEISKNKSSTKKKLTEAFIAAWKYILSLDFFREPGVVDAEERCGCDQVQGLANQTLIAVVILLLLSYKVCAKKN